MKPPKSTLIISVYKDIESLNLILKSLEKQTHLPDEVLVSEDGDSKEMLRFINLAKDKYSKLNITHSFQEDAGWQKNKALNKAVMAAKNEYLIFIDGDCLPFYDFIENHVNKAKRNQVLAGKRVELGPEITKSIYAEKLSPEKLAKSYWLYLPKLIKDKARHLEDIIHIKHNSFLSFLTNKPAKSIIGCNWSVYKEDLVKINGFDEDYTSPSVGEDTDLEWRFIGKGIKINSCRYNANLLHLYHEKRFDMKANEINKKMMFKKESDEIFICYNGIKKLEAN